MTTPTTPPTDAALLARLPALQEEIDQAAAYHDANPKHALTILDFMGLFSLFADRIDWPLDDFRQCLEMYGEQLASLASMFHAIGYRQGRKTREETADVDR